MTDVVSEFDQAWRAYPRKVAKIEARKAWDQMLKRTGLSAPELLAKTLDALAWQCLQPGWIKDGGQFIPHFATWLRAARWEDEPIHPPQISDRTARTLLAAQRVFAPPTRGQLP